MVELLIVMSLLSVVLSLAGVGLVSLSRAAKETQDRAEATTVLRQAVERLSKDIRAANPIEVLADVSDYDDKIAFSVFCTPPASGCSASGLRPLIY